MPGVKGGSGTRQSRGPALRGGQHSRGLPGRLTKGASPRAVYDLRQVLAGLLLLGGDHGAHLGRAGQGAGEVSPTAGHTGKSPTCAWSLAGGGSPGALDGAPPPSCHRMRWSAQHPAPVRFP